MNKIFTIAMVALLVVFTLGVTLADPNGAGTVTQEASGRATADSAGNHSAIAGNVTELTVVGNSVTQSWQGYYGNVSGTIMLEDSSGNTMYNWSLASPQGEIFASEDSSVSWSNVQCFNWTENGTTLETTYNVNDSVDGVNETFTDGNSHVAFSVGSTSFSAGECMSADIFDNSGSSSDGTFEEVLLAQSTGQIIFASLLEEDASGFDGSSHDFEMLVLEDGHSGNTETTAYYFYVELE